MFTVGQREKIRAALERRAEAEPVRLQGKFRRAAKESRLFDRLVDKLTAKFKREKPNAADGEILKMILDFIKTSGIIELILSLFLL
jgi:DUF1009 family protein